MFDLFTSLAAIFLFVFMDLDFCLKAITENQSSISHKYLCECLRRSNAWPLSTQAWGSKTKRLSAWASFAVFGEAFPQRLMTFQNNLWIPTDVSLTTYTSYFLVCLKMLKKKLCISAASIHSPPERDTTAHIHAPTHTRDPEGRTPSPSPWNLAPSADWNNRCNNVVVPEILPHDWYIYTKIFSFFSDSQPSSVSAGSSCFQLSRLRKEAVSHHRAVRRAQRLKLLCELFEAQSFSNSNISVRPELQIVVSHNNQRQEKTQTFKSACLLLFAFTFCFLISVLLKVLTCSHEVHNNWRSSLVSA